jgi:arginase
MSRKIQLLINTSELTAGTRGASLGPGALFTAARKNNNDYFGKHSAITLENLNQLLDTPNNTPYAKYINGFENVFNIVKTAVTTSIQEQNFPLILAGDHGSAAGTIAGIKAAYPDKRLGVVWIDAHGDLHSPYTTPSGNMHGMPLSIALGYDNLECKHNDPDQNTVDTWNRLKNSDDIQPKILPVDLVFVGVRDTEQEEDFILQNKNITNILVETVRKEGAAAVVEKINTLLAPCDILYVSFDVDSMDPEITSFGTGTPVGNGIFPEEAEEMLTLLAQNEKTVCMEFVEVNPCLDNKINTMAEVTFHLLEKVSEAIQSS